MHPFDGRDLARRRGQRTGYLYRRGPSWFVQYRVDSVDLDANGKFKRPTLTKYVAPATGPGKVTEKQAQRIAWDEYLSKLDLMATRPGSMKTIAEFVKERFEPDVVWSLKPSGKAHYRLMLKNHVLPALGSIRLRDLEPRHVQDLVRATLERGLAVQTAMHVRNTVSAIFRHAKRLQAYAGDLPTEGVRLPALNVPERRSLTWPQVLALAATIGKPDETKERKKHTPAPNPEMDRARNETLGTLVMVLALTGLRIGEAMGLRWKRVNLEGEPRTVDGETLPAYTLAVRENYVQTSMKATGLKVGASYGTLKTKGSRRNIPLSAEAWVALSRLKPGAPDAPVFVSRAGTPLDHRNIGDRYLKAAAKRIGCPWVSWHTLRHTNSTLADQAGLSVSERQRILGHATAQQTLAYTHAELDVVRGRMEQIGKERVN